MEQPTRSTVASCVLPLTAFIEVLQGKVRCRDTKVKHGASPTAGWRLRATIDVALDHSQFDCLVFIVATLSQPERNSEERARGQMCHLLSCFTVFNTPPQQKAGYGDTTKTRTLPFNSFQPPSLTRVELRLPTLRALSSWSLSSSFFF